MEREIKKTDRHSKQVVHGGMSHGDMYTLCMCLTNHMHTLCICRWNEVVMHDGEDGDSTCIGYACCVHDDDDDYDGDCDDHSTE